MMERSTLMRCGVVVGDDGGCSDCACVWLSVNRWWRALDWADADKMGKTAARGFVLWARRGEGVSVFFFFGFGRGVGECGWAGWAAPFTSCGGRCVRLCWVLSGGGVVGGGRHGGLGAAAAAMVVASATFLAGVVERQVFMTVVQSVGVVVAAAMALAVVTAVLTGFTIVMGTWLSAATARDVAAVITVVAVAAATARVAVTPVCQRSHPRMKTTELGTGRSVRRSSWMGGGSEGGRSSRRPGGGGSGDGGDGDNGGGDGGLP